MVLQKYTENSIDGARKQRESFKRKWQQKEPLGTQKGIAEILWTRENRGFGKLNTHGPH